MRRLIPALALLAAAACAEQATAPSPGAPQLASQATPATAWTRPAAWSIDLCGYDIADGVGTLHHVMRFTTDPATGLWHFVHEDHYKMRFTGRYTGQTWRYNDNTFTQDQWRQTATQYGPDAWMVLNEHVRMIGENGAPSFDANNVIHMTVNANGEPVTEHVKLDPLCS